MPSQRIERVNTLIQQLLGDILLREIELPTGSFVTISKVQTSRDLQHARVWIVIHPEQQELPILRLLNRSRSSVQYLLHQQMKLRHSPKIFFVIDEQAKKAQHIDTILDSLDT